MVGESRRKTKNRSRLPSKAPSRTGLANNLQRFDHFINAAPWRGLGRLFRVTAAKSEYGLQAAVIHDPGELVLGSAHRQPVALLVHFFERVTEPVMAIFEEARVGDVSCGRFNRPFGEKLSLTVAG